MQSNRGRRAAFSQAARRAVLSGCAAFVTLQLGLAIAIAYWIPELRDPFYGYKAAHLRARAKSEQSTTVVMLGSSRTVFGLKAGLLERQLRDELGRPVIVFNFGIFGAGPVIELLTLRRLLDDGVRPDLVLVEVLPALLTTDRQVPREAHWLPAERLWLPELRWLRQFGFPFRDLRRTWLQAWPIPWYAHRFAIVSRLSPAWLPTQLRQDWGRADDPSGWSGASTPPSTPEQYQRGIARARLEYFETLQHFELGDPAVRALRELLQICQREHIPTALLLMPEGSEFRSWFPAPALAQTQALLAELRQQYGSAVVDARAWVADEYFSDAHHLVDRGAEAFTLRLGEALVLPFLTGATTPHATMVSRKE